MNFDSLTQWLYGRRAFIVIVIFAGVCLSVFATRRANFSENIFDLLPADDEIVQAHICAGNVFKKSNSLYFAIARNSPDSSEQADEFATRLRKISNVRDVVCSVGKDFDFARLAVFMPSLFDEACAERLRENLAPEILSARFKTLKNGVTQNDYLAKYQLKNDPLGVSESFAPVLRKAFSFKGAKIENFKVVSNNGKYFLLVLTGDFDCADSGASAKFIDEIERTIVSMKCDFPTFSTAYAGGYRISAVNAQVARNSSNACVLVTIILMALICIASFRNRWLALVAILPSLIGSAVALGVVCVLFDRVSSISIAFASIAIGVSIDYAVHVLHFIDSVKGKVSITDSKVCVAKLCTPIAIVSGTTIMAFVIMTLWGTGSFLQLGVFGVVGVAVSAFISVFLLPIFLIGRSLKTLQKVTLVERIADFLEKRSPQKGLIFFAIFLLLPSGIFIARGKLFNGDMSFFNGLNSEAKADEVLLRASFADALSTRAFLLRASSFDELLRKNEILQNDLKTSGFISTFGAQNLLVSDALALENLKRWRDFWQTDFSASIREACAEVGLNYNMVINANKRFVDSAKLLSFVQLSASPIWKIFASNVYVGEGEFAMLSTFVADNSRNLNDSLKKIEQTSSVGARVIAPDYLGARIAEVSVQWLGVFALLAFVGASVYLRFTFGNFRAVYAVLIPVVLGLFFALAFFSVLSIRINIINSIFVIFAVCLAQDYAVFVYNAVKNNIALGKAYAPILVSSATTVVAFGVLAFSAHPAISSLGAASAVSIASITFAVLLFGKSLSKWALQK